MNSRILSIPIAALALAAHALGGADPRGDNPGTLPSTPEKEKAMFHLPPGFEIQLVAAGPEIQKPINITFDGDGRLWVTGSEMYPWPASVEADGKPIPDFATAYAALTGAFHVSDKASPASNIARDTVRVLGDFDETGRARKISLFADGLNIPSGVQPLPRQPGSKGDTVIVYSIPNIWRLEDTTGNGRADQREALYGTAGFLDTHGGMSSFLYWMDGWIYGTHGFRNHSELHDQAGRVTVLDSGNTYRFRPDGSAFEIYSHGQTNPFGLTVDPFGNFYTADSHSRPVYMLLRGGWYEGINKQHDGLGFAPRITDDDHGSTAIGGIAYYADDRFPEEYRGNTFNGNVVTQKINRDKLAWHGSTPQAIRMPDFLTSDDPWFRPVQVKLGPDGALWIADFYNPIIGHYEVPLTDPNRDHTHGRIWRIVYRGEKQGPAEALPNVAKLDVEGLLNSLRSPNLVVRILATNELVDRVGKDAAPQIKKLVSKIPLSVSVDKTSSGSPETMETYRSPHLLWAMERLGQGQDLSVGGDAFISRSPVVLSAAARIASLHNQTGLEEMWEHRLLDDDKVSFAPAVKRACVEGLGSHPTKETVRILIALWKSTPSEDTELVHAVRMALRDNLVAPNGYAEALKLAADDSDISEKVADVSLGAPTPEAAEYLLGHLERTKLSTPRAGEYLRHAALNIAPERITAVAALLDSLNSAPLTQRLSAADGLTQAARQRGVHLPDATTAWLQRTMVEALGSGNEALLKRAIESVREAKIDAKFQPLASIVDNTRRPIKLRVSSPPAWKRLAKPRPTPRMARGSFSRPAPSAIGSRTSAPPWDHSLTESKPAASIGSSKISSTPIATSIPCFARPSSRPPTVNNCRPERPRRRRTPHRHRPDRKIRLRPKSESESANPNPALPDATRL